MRAAHASRTLARSENRPRLCGGGGPSIDEVDRGSIEQRAEQALGQ
jgi:hypothetical protein